MRYMTNQENNLTQNIKAILFHESKILGSYVLLPKSKRLLVGCDFNICCSKNCGLKKLLQELKRQKHNKFKINIQQ
jgi:hypothetical protein